MEIARTKIEPTVGRIVHVYERSIDDYAGPYAGIIVGLGFIPDKHGQPWVSVRVWSTHQDDRTVYVPILDPLTPEQRWACPYAVLAEWMPYQKGQAALTEQIATAAGLLDKADGPAAT